VRITDVSVDEAAVAALLGQPGVREDMRRRADRVVQAAKQTAPVDTGEYRDSIHAEDGPDGSVLVVSDTDHSIFVEHGTREPGHPAHFTLTNALDAAGDD
jgi:hypothetical protein